MIIKFYLKNKDIIYCYIRGFGKRREIILNTKMRIDRNHWNKEKEEAKKSFSEYIEFNRYLARYKAKINRNLLKFLQDKNITFNQLKQDLSNSIDFSTSDEVLTYIQQYIDEKTGVYAPNTIKKYVTLKNHLKNFSVYSDFQLTFENINMNFINQFQKYSIDVLKLNNNTFNKYVENLKTIINYCNDIEVTDINNTRKFKLKEYKIEIITLTENELEQLENVKLKKQHLQNLKDVFLFSIYTGQRFSDISKVKAKDIDLKNKVWNLRTVKTKDIIKIPLSDRAVEIAKKHFFNIDFLPTISSQKTNEQLKELCKEAEIDVPVTMTSYIGNKAIQTTKPKYELISSHTARRTFVTLSLIKGIQPNILMKITGHKDFKTLNKYIRIDNQVTQTALNDAWNNKPIKINNQ